MSDAGQRYEEKQEPPTIDEEPAELVPSASIVTDEIFGKEIKASYPAKIIRIVDGDTIEILIDEKEVRVRLESIDTPEPRKGKKPAQPFSKQESILGLRADDEPFAPWVYRKMKTLKND